MGPTVIKLFPRLGLSFIWDFLPNPSWSEVIQISWVIVKEKDPCKLLLLWLCSRRLGVGIQWKRYNYFHIGMLRNS